MLLKLLRWPDPVGLLVDGVVDPGVGVVVSVVGVGVVVVGVVQWWSSVVVVVVVVVV